MTGTFSLLLDLVIAGLLAATIVYAVILNRQLTRLRDGRAEMEALIKRFAEATSQADAGVKGMKRAAAESGEALQKNIERAVSLRDEFSRMIESAESLVARLEGVPGVERPSRSGARGGGRNDAPLRSEMLRTEQPRSEKTVRPRPPAEPRVVSEARIESMRDVVREAMRAGPPTDAAAVGRAEAVAARLSEAVRLADAGGPKRAEPTLGAVIGAAMEGRDREDASSPLSSAEALERDHNLDSVARAERELLQALESIR